jgi:hypothetical protein
MRHPLRWLAAVVLCAGMAIPVLPAQAKAPGPNGQIVFSRFDPALGDMVTYAVNPDGSHQQQLFPGASEFPRWSPDGSQVSLLARCSDGEEVWVPEIRSQALSCKFARGVTWPR